MSAHELTLLLFLQLAFILAFSRLVGLALRRLHQPQVVGEMVAGVLVGPSLLGACWPGAQAALFPADSTPLIYALSQLGLVLYMFQVGAGFDRSRLRRHLRSAAAVSVAGIAAPFSLGALLAYGLAGDHGLFSPGVEVWEAMLFTGAAMAITAFPMLARIIHERGLSDTALGTLVLAAGGVNDVAAWGVLAVVLASFSGDAGIAVRAVLGGALYACACWWVVRPWLRRVFGGEGREAALGGNAWALLLVLLLAGAWFTDYVRIYAVFGAFVLGVALPRGEVVAQIQRGMGPLTTYLLVPLFFVYSGLHTRLDQLVAPERWLLLVVLVLLACLGKGVACWLAARLHGESPRDALAVGVLMNARGMMELLLLNMGLEEGLITPTLFTLMVAMTIITTLMATPLFELIYRRVSPPGRGAGKKGTASAAP